MRFLLSSIFLILPLFCFGQLIQRSSISSIGGSHHSEGLFIQQILGQPYSTPSVEGSQLFQGFIQPNNYDVIKVTASIEMDVKVYPNPTHHFISIETEEIFETVLIRITALNGKIIYQQSHQMFSSIQLDCQAWSAGVYFIYLEDSTNRQSNTYKIIKQ